MVGRGLKISINQALEMEMFPKASTDKECYATANWNLTNDKAVAVGSHDSEKCLEREEELDMPLKGHPRGPRRPKRRCIYVCDDEYGQSIDGRCYNQCVFKMGDGHTRHQWFPQF